MVAKRRAAKQAAPPVELGAVDKFAAAASAPSAFLTPSDSLSADARTAVKELYDHLSAKAPKVANPESGGALPELYVAGFDVEQIWLQVDLQTKAVLKTMKGALKTVSDTDAKALFPVRETGEEEDEDEAGEGGESDKDDGSAGTGEDLSFGEGDDGISGEDEEDEFDDKEEEGEDEGEGEGEDGELLPTEDDFFRLDDMERFVSAAEEEAARAPEDAGDDDEIESDIDEDEAVDLFAASEDEDEDEDDLAAALQYSSALVGKRRGGGGGSDDEGEDEDGAGLMYSDFFGRGKRGGGGKGRAGGRRPSGGSDEEDEDEDEDEDEAGEEDGAPGRAQGAGGGRDLLAGSDEDDSDNDDDGAPTAHERQQQRLAERTRRLEEANMGERPWELTGEVAANQRPLNSALQVQMEFDHAAAPAPVMTEESTASLEEVIKRRIAEGRYDDVVRKLPPDDGAGRKGPGLELDDQKSAKGLGELYEEDYVRATQGADALGPTKEDRARSEARVLFKQLCGKLDALSHFHFAPKPVVEDMAVRADVPALAMEEVAPLAMTTADQMTPGEVYKPEAGGAKVADGELSREDRRRLRAQKKRKAKNAAAEKEASKKAREAAKGIVHSAATVVDGFKMPATGGKVVKQAAGTRSKFSKSGEVFKQLQEEADTGGPKKFVKPKDPAALVNLKL